jgi:hypothetical protein
MKTLANNFLQLSITVLVFIITVVLLTFPALVIGYQLLAGK